MANNKLSEEDKALFRAQLAGVKPLNRKNTVVETPKKTKPVIREPQAEHSEHSPPHLSDFIAQPLGSESILSWSVHSLPARQFTLLKKGKIHYQAQLDLHGLNRDAAAHDLYQFIKHHQQRDHQCVKIIHGKGGRKGESPVIKNLINQWLRQLDEVLAFHSCQPADGGTGAVYALLKRNKY